MANPLSMVLMSYRGTEQGHDSITSELVDRALASVNLIHQNLETTVHDLVHFFGIKLFRHSGIIGDVGKQHCHQLSFAFEGTSVGKDFILEELWSVGLGFCIVDGRYFGRNH